MVCHILHAYLTETPKVHQVSSRIDQAVLSEPIAALNPNIRRAMSKFFGLSHLLITITLRDGTKRCRICAACRFCHTKGLQPQTAISDGWQILLFL